MCGRFAQHLTWRQIRALYQLPESARPLHLHPRYNGAPVQDFAVCRLDTDGSRALATLRWGLVQPERAAGRRTVRSRVLRAHWGASAGADCFTTDVWTAKGLVTYYTLFILNLASRRVQMLGSTAIFT